MHRTRQGYVEARTACINHIRGLHTVVGNLLSELHRLDERVADYDGHIAAIARQDERAGELMKLQRAAPPPPRRSWRRSARDTNAPAEGSELPLDCALKPHRGSAKKLCAVIWQLWPMAPASMYSFGEVRNENAR